MALSLITYVCSVCILSSVPLASLTQEALLWTLNWPDRAVGGGTMWEDEDVIVTLIVFRETADYGLKGSREWEAWVLHFLRSVIWWFRKLLLFFSPNFKNFDSFLFAFTSIVDLPLFARPLRVHVPLTPYLQTHPSPLHNRLQKSGIWWMEMWQVIMLLSLAECFELSPTHALTLARQGLISLSCESDEWKPKGRKPASWRADLKGLVVFAQGQSSLRYPSCVSFLVSWVNFLIDIPTSL